MVLIACATLLSADRKLVLKLYRVLARCQETGGTPTSNYRSVVRRWLRHWRRLWAAWTSTVWHRRGSFPLSCRLPGPVTAKNKECWIAGGDPANIATEYAPGALFWFLKLVIDANDMIVSIQFIQTRDYDSTDWRHQEARSTAVRSTRLELSRCYYHQRDNCWRCRHPK